MKKIRDLVIDEQFEQFVLIKSADVRIAKNGKKFIAFTFQDTSGTGMLRKRKSINLQLAQLFF